MGTSIRMAGRGLLAAAAVCGAAALAVTGVAGARAVSAAIGTKPAAGGWGRAIEVPGLGRLNAGGQAEVLPVSCGSAGNCVAAGYYTDSHGHEQGFVAGERSGRWGQASQVPGLGRLNAGGQAEVGSVSCASAGNCTAGGYYTDRHGHDQGFVAAERGGRWGRASQVPGLGTLNAAGYARVSSVSCAAAGNCAAGGIYTSHPGHPPVIQGFVAVEKNGRWANAIEVPGLGALNTGDSAGFSSLSCGSAGNCTAGGFYLDQQRAQQGFVAVEQNGRWANAIEVPGLGTLNTGGQAGVFSVSCASAGNCAASGDYADLADQSEQGFVVSERNGVWGTASDVPGLAALNTAGDADVSSVSCPSAGNCAAGGYYGTNDLAIYQGFVAVERHGRWGLAIEVPGLATLSFGMNSGMDQTTSVSCASAGNCAAGGDYINGSDHGQAFVVSQKNGAWGQAIKVPGTAALNKDFAFLNSVSCASPGSCAAGGDYTDRHGHNQGFVANQT